MMVHRGPMAIGLSEEQAMLMDSAREFCRSRSDMPAVRALIDSDTGFEPAVWQELAELGWLGLAIPEEHGGSALGVGSAVPIVESMGRQLMVTPFVNSTLAGQALLRGGSVEQRSEYLPRIAEGEIATLALLESEDWGADQVAASATSDGETLELAGVKVQVADASVASLLIVSVSFGGERRLLLVPGSALEGSALTREVLLDETRRSARVDFTGVRVPQANLLPGDYATVMRDIKLIGALLLAAEATGSAAACLDTTAEYLKTRKQFGRLIGSYQALKHPMVDILCAVDSAKSFIYHAAALVSGQALDRDAEIACRMAKTQACEALRFAADRAIQFHGGMGFTYECDAQLYIRRAQWSQQAYGDAGHHRKRLAGLLLDSPGSA